MLSDEEKKAIEIQDSISILENTDLDINNIYSIDLRTYNFAVKTVVNIVKKQQKEIEELKKKLDLDNECEIALNNRIMDLETEIEELKDTRSIFNMGRRSYKNEIEDKIKAKIEEYDDKGMTINLTNRSAGKTFQQAVHYEVKKILQSLLEKE